MGSLGGQRKVFVKIAAQGWREPPLLDKPEAGPIVSLPPSPPQVLRDARSSTLLGYARPAITGQPEGVC